MGERKVLNKYYPPDFDPAKIPRRRQPRNQQIKVRMMLPMSIRCTTCGTYIYKGTKFNSRKEDVIGETYLGIQIFRFYFKCTKCSAEITMKTDPQNSDYTVESGASRNFEPWRNEDEAAENKQRKRDAEEMGDAMKSLENRAMDSKQDMDILAALEEMRSMKSRHATVSFDMMLETLQRTTEEKGEKIMEEDEALIKSIVFRGSKDYVHRIQDDDDNEDEEDDEEDMDKDTSQTFAHTSELLAHRNKAKGTPELPSAVTDTLSKSSIFNNSKNQEALGRSLLKPKFILKPRNDNAKKPRIEPSEDNKPRDEIECKTDGENNDASAGLLSLCQNYDSDESD